MKANELRIGNYYNQFGNNERVSWATLKTVEEDMNEKLWCKPIPLTEEWLLKFGFKKEVECFYIHYDMIECISLKFHFDGWYIEDNDRGFINTKPIKYVHQLQNLYFALTEDELSFKPE